MSKIPMLRTVIIINDDAMSEIKRYPQQFYERLVSSRVSPDGPPMNIGIGDCPDAFAVVERGYTATANLMLVTGLTARHVMRMEGTSVQLGDDRYVLRLFKGKIEDPTSRLMGAYNHRGGG